MGPAPARCKADRARKWLWLAKNPGSDEHDYVSSDPDALHGLTLCEVCDRVCPITKGSAHLDNAYARWVRSRSRINAMEVLKSILALRVCDKYAYEIYTEITDYRNNNGVTLRHAMELHYRIYGITTLHDAKPNNIF